MDPVVDKIDIAEQINNKETNNHEHPSETLKRPASDDVSEGSNNQKLKLHQYALSVSNQGNNGLDESNVIMEALRILNLFDKNEPDFSTHIEAFRKIVKNNLPLISRIDKSKWNAMMLAVELDIPEALEALMKESKSVDSKVLHIFLTNPPYENKRCLSLIKKINPSVINDTQTRLENALQLSSVYKQNRLETIRLIKSHPTNIDEHTKSLDLICANIKRLSDQIDGYKEKLRWTVKIQNLTETKKPSSDANGQNIQNMPSGDQAPPRKPKI